MAEPPPDLARLKLLEWVRQHPVKGYFPDKPMSAGEIAHHAGVTVAVEILGHLVKRLHPITWLHIAWEAMVLQAERDELPGKRREAQREAFRQYMQDKFWSDESLYDSKATREAAFDRYAGNTAGHAIVPALTQEAEIKRREMMDEVSDRWLERSQTLSGLQERVDFYEKNKPDLATNEEHKRNLEQAAGLHKRAEELRQIAALPGDTRWVKDPGHVNGGYSASIHREQHLRDAAYAEQQAKVLEVAVPQGWANATDIARREVESHKTMMANEAAKEVQSVRDFESRSSNWVYTPEMVDTLSSKAQPEPAEPADDQRSDNDRFYDIVGGRPD